MRIVPAHKSDFEACRNLAVAPAREVQAHLPALLEWLQDANWPVAPLVVECLKGQGLSLVEPVRAVLRGEDEVWKYWVVSRLLSEVDAAVFEALVPELVRLADAPSAGEAREEVHLVTREVLAQREGWSRPSAREQ